MFPGPLSACGGAAPQTEKNRFALCCGAGTVDQMKKRVAVFFTVFFILLLPWLGVYLDREFPSFYLFLKHRPSFDLFFYSPLGEADQSETPGVEGYLTPDKAKKEGLFVEYVEEHRGYKRALHLPIYRVVRFFVR